MSLLHGLYSKNFKILFQNFVMTPPGNYVCIFLVVLETFLFNGVFAGWGILTAMLKEDELFFHEESWNRLHFKISAIFGQ